MPLPRPSRARPVLSSVLALSLLAGLAACSQAPQTGPATYRAARSYDPPGPPHDPWGPWIREASRRFDVPERWIREVMRQESGGRAGATSPVGAMGLMQVMPGTYRELQRRHNLGDDPYHPYDNLMAGTAYIREMYNLYGSPAFLAAYNAGPRRLEDFLYNGRGLPAETRNYVARVGPGVIRSSPVRRAPAEVYAAAEIPLSIPQGPRRMDASTRMALAEQRSIREQNARYASLPAAEPAAAAPPPVQMAAAAPVTPVRRSGSVVAMEPIPDGSTPEGAARLAEAAARAAGEAPPPSLIAGGAAPAPTAAPFGQILPDGRIIVARMEPIPDGSTPEGAARLAETESRPAPARHALIALAPPPPPTPVAARPGGRSLGLIASAQAAPLPPTLRPSAPTPGGGSWAIQVGAFGSPEQARQAAAAAAGRVGGRVQVSPVAQGRSTLFRARVVGLSQPTAQQACDRLRNRGGCTVLSPAAQS
ncbi:MAG: lytic transglycosylase domain-containing protein [Rubritepida sp.]|nr:lytic transglycosylase domain-containing protein [Rubritepida sp.]